LQISALLKKFIVWIDFIFFGRDAKIITGREKRTLELGVNVSKLKSFE
jgi:hypothetical protein